MSDTCWEIPVAFTVVMLLVACRPYHYTPTGFLDFDPTPFIRMLWVIPIMAVWIVYLSICMWLGV